MLIYSFRVIMSTHDSVLVSLLTLIKFTDQLICLIAAVTTRVVNARLEMNSGFTFRF